MDKDKFLFLYTNEFGELNDCQRGGLLDLLSFFEADEKMTDPRWIAYCLATTFHETAKTWLPIREYGRGKGKPYGLPADNGQTFYGRGYVQLTHADNYKAMSKVVGVDLYQSPDEALIPAIAYKIMSYGMRNGSFTGVGLSRYINATQCNYTRARRIINGLDCADKVASYAVRLEKILKGAV